MSLLEAMTENYLGSILICRTSHIRHWSTYAARIF